MKILVLIIITFLCSNVLASRRWIDLSWDKLESAFGYEIEIYVEKNGEKVIFTKDKTKENSWSKKVIPGKYYFRLRGIDSREVPGEWSESALVDVRLPKPIYVNPLPNDRLKGLEDLEEKIFFEWKRVEGAGVYLFQVWDNKDFLQTKYIKENSIDLYLKVAQDYKWRVVALKDRADEVPDRQGSGIKFFLQGGAIKAPNVKYSIENEKVIFLWSETSHANEYEIQIFKLGLNQRWAMYERKEFYTDNNIEFPLKEMQGNFRFALKAKNEGRADSPFTFIEFKVKEKSFVVQSQKTQNNMNNSKDNPFFYSYGGELTYLDYYGESRERDTIVETTFKGMRYFIEASYQDFYSLWKHRLGVYLTNVSNIDYSAQLSEYHYLLGQTRVYKGIPFEFSVGFFYKEDLFIEGDRFSNELTFDKVTTAGPVFRIGPYYRFNRYFDIGSELKLFWHSLSYETPNGEEIDSTFSYYVKGFVTYKRKDDETYTGFIGYYFNNISYKAVTTGESIASPGTSNIGTSTGFSMGLQINKFF
jgi:hypothetical protein